MTEAHNHTGRIEYLDPAQLEDNPANWKFHPPDQLEVIGSSIERLGHLKPLGTYNERTRRLLDGHARKSILAGKGPVPIWVVDLPEELEAEALATLDPSGWTSIADKAKFTALLERAPKIDHAATKALLDKVRATAQNLEAKEEQREDEKPDVEIPLDSLWPSSNPYGVPDLDLSMQAESIPTPVMTWGSLGHTRHMPGTWHLYTWDFKFEPLWKRPGRVTLSGAKAIVEPNFSTTDQSPLSLSLWHVYRKRWLGRYWQARGLRVLVDLNVSPALNKPSDALGGLTPNLIGVHPGWSAFASRAHGNHPELLEAEYEVAREWSGRDNPLFLCVGGGRRVKTLATEKGWVWVPEQVEQALGKRESA